MKKMKRQTWNSWTFTGSDDDAGRSHGDSVIECVGLGRTHDKKEQPTWLERSFQTSLGQAMDKALDLSDERLNRVERIRAEIAEGRYRVSTEKLAERLMQNMIGKY